jgi:hypothetical protein
VCHGNAQPRSGQNSKSQYSFLNICSRQSGDIVLPLLTSGVYTLDEIRLLDLLCFPAFVFSFRKNILDQTHAEYSFYYPTYMSPAHPGGRISTTGCVLQINKCHSSFSLS